MKPANTFTKRDIIVVLVCIIFLLANIAAVGEGGRMRAKQAVCLSNLLKWGQIFHAYTADNDGFFYSRPASGSVASYLRIWPYVYKPYYIDPMMRFCPAADNINRVGGPFGVWDWRYGSYNPTIDPAFWVQGENGPPYGSYGMNRYIETLQGSYAADPAFWRRADVNGASQVPVFFDCQYVYVWGSANAEPPAYDGDWTVGDTQSAACINRHNSGSINCLFLDFSARKVGLKELWVLKWSRTFNTCGPWTICGFDGDQEACAAAWDVAAPWMKDFPEY